MAGNIQLEKQRIREAVRVRKNKLNRSSLEAMSKQVTSNLESLAIFPRKRGQSLIYFVGKSQTCEVQTLPHIQALLDRGLEVWLPKTIVEEKTLKWGQVENIEADLTVGAFSVKEPTDSVIARRVINFALLEIIIVPGLAFDEQGRRMGYGQGYYDRFLRSFSPSCPVVGLAFEFQVFPEIPIEPHDAHVDYLVTEQKIRHFSN